MIRRWIGKLIFKVVRAAGKCLAAYFISIIIERSNEIMLTANNGNGKKVSLWGAIGQIALAGIASYGMTKINNDETSWVPYRDEMVAGMASTAMSFFAQQMAAATQPTTAEQTTETAAQ